MAMTFAYETLGDWLVVTCDWTTDALGDASGTTARIVGELVKATTIPSAEFQPTDDYDIALTDAAGLDVLAPSTAKLINRDSVAAEAVYFCFDNPLDGFISRVPAIADALTITVAVAGNTKQGQLILLFRGRLAGTR